MATNTLVYGLDKDRPALEEAVESIYTRPAIHSLTGILWRRSHRASLESGGPSDLRNARALEPLS